jgi:hypothetical protein
LTLLNDSFFTQVYLIFVGWAASTDKHVTKYADIYKSFGYHTIRIAVSLASAVYNVHEHDEFVSQLFKQIKTDCKLDQSPIIVHLFSNTGMFIYRKIVEKYEEDEFSFFKTNLKCLIYDSSPGHAESGIAFVKNTFDLVVQRTNSYLLGGLVTIAGIIAFRLKHLGRDYLVESINYLADDANSVPTLFYYSKTDQMVSYKEVLNFIERRKAVVSATTIKSVEFADTDHVRHYYKCKEVYLTHLKEHLQTSGLHIYDEIPSKSLSSN